MAKRNSCVVGVWILGGEDSEWEPEADLTVNPDFDVVEAVFGELDATKDVDVGGMGIQSGQMESDRGFCNRGIVIAAQDQRFLLKFPGATAPPRPQAELEKSNWHNWRGDDIDHTHQRLAAIDFLANVFTKDRSLQIWEDVCRLHRD